MIGRVRSRRWLIGSRRSGSSGLSHLNCSQTGPGGFSGATPPSFHTYTFSMLF